MPAVIIRCWYCQRETRVPPRHVTLHHQIDGQWKYSYACSYQDCCYVNVGCWLDDQAAVDHLIAAGSPVTEPDKALVVFAGQLDDDNLINAYRDQWRRAEP